MDDLWMGKVNGSNRVTSLQIELYQQNKQCENKYSINHSLSRMKKGIKVHHPIYGGGSYGHVGGE